MLAKSARASPSPSLPKRWLDRHRTPKLREMCHESCVISTTRDDGATLDIAQHEAVLKSMLALARDGGVVAADEDVAQLDSARDLHAVRDDAAVEVCAGRDAAIVPND